MMTNFQELIKLNEGIYTVCGTWLKHSSLLATRSYIIKNNDARGILVIDTCGPGSGSIIFNAVKSYGLNPADITGIAITHWHRDHTGGLAELVSLIAGSGGGPVKVFMHESDAGIFLQQKGRFLKIHPLIKLPVYHNL
jgi:glyoxylase-like metal-dependent hydrolase (beta-lactamase superfamily II)